MLWDQHQHVERASYGLIYCDCLKGWSRPKFGPCIFSPLILPYCIFNQLLQYSCPLLLYYSILLYCIQYFYFMQYFAVCIVLLYFWPLFVLLLLMLKGGQKYSLKGPKLPLWPLRPCCQTVKINTLQVHSGFKHPNSTIFFWTRWFHPNLWA
jgi:hypothetical protein